MKSVGSVWAEDWPLDVAAVRDASVLSLGNPGVDDHRVR